MLISFPLPSASVLVLTLAPDEELEADALLLFKDADALIINDVDAGEPTVSDWM